MHIRFALFLVDPITKCPLELVILEKQGNCVLAGNFAF